MHAMTILVALVAFLVLALVLAMLYSRYRQKLMLHQERMSALEKGTSIPLGPEPAPWSPRVYLLRGLIWTFSGAALIVCLLGLAWASSRPQSATLVAMRAREISRSLEIPIDQARQIAEKDGAAERQGMPLGIALLGVIPLAVGLAYLVFYFTDDSRKRLAAEAGNPTAPTP
jgi:amino acid transporter